MNQVSVQPPAVMADFFS